MLTGATTASYNNINVNESNVGNKQTKQEEFQENLDNVGKQQ